MTIGGIKASNETLVEATMRKDLYKGVILLEQNTHKKTDSVKPENIKRQKKFQFPYFGEKLNLNTNNENHVASSYKQFDMNGVS